MLAMKFKHDVHAFVGRSGAKSDSSFFTGQRSETLPLGFSRAKMGLAAIAAILLPSLLAGHHFGLAAPAFQNAVEEGRCEWHRLSSGPAAAQHSLIEVPGQGVLAFGGMDAGQRPVAVTDTLSLLNLEAGRPGQWSEMESWGEKPGPRAEHASVLRPAEGRSGDDLRDELITFGGIDAPYDPGGTFAWRSPLVGMGARPNDMRSHPQVSDRTNDQRMPADLPKTLLDDADSSRPVADRLATESLLASESRLGLTDMSATRSDAHRLVLDPDEPRWEALAADEIALSDHSAIYDPNEDAIIVFGGREEEAVSSVTDQLMRLRLAEARGPAARTWEALELPDGPDARFGHSSVYDPVSQAHARLWWNHGLDRWQGRSMGTRSFQRLVECHLGTRGGFRVH